MLGGGGVRVDGGAEGSWGLGLDGGGGGMELGGVGCEVGRLESCE